MHRPLTLDTPSFASDDNGFDLVRTVLWGTLLTGTLDGLEATAFWALRGVATSRVFQGIAAGVLGRSAFDGGAATAALGIALMFFICAVIVALYVSASRWLPSLAERPWRWGPVYGAVTFTVMNFVVVPLSAASGRALHLVPMLNCLAANIACIGIPTALVARAAARSRDRL
jgi:hypothetical protein